MRSVTDAALMTTMMPRANSATTAATINTSGRPVRDAISPPPPRPALKREQAQRGKRQRQQPESRDHLRLRPPAQLEMVVKRAHLKDAPPSRHAEIHDLD